MNLEARYPYTPMYRGEGERDGDREKNPPIDKDRETERVSMYVSVYVT